MLLVTQIYSRPNQGLWDICGFCVFFFFEKRAEPIIGRHKDKSKYSWDNTERLDSWKSRQQGGGRNESFHNFFFLNESGDSLFCSSTPEVICSTSSYSYIHTLLWLNQMLHVCTWLSSRCAVCKRLQLLCASGNQTVLHDTPVHYKNAGLFISTLNWIWTDTIFGYIFQV